MHSEYRKTWNFYNDEEVRNKVIAEYGDLMKIPDDKAKEILEKYLDIDVWEAEFSEEGEIAYTTIADKEDFERAEAEAEEDAEEYSRDPYSYNGVSRSDF
jgi:hypothetical protein